MNSNSFLFSGAMESRDPTEEQNELFLISTDLTLIKIKQTNSGYYRTMRTQSIQHIDGIAKAIDQRKNFETMSISDRSIVFRNKIFSIDSGRSFDALTKDEEDKGDISSFPVQYSDKIAYQAKNERGEKLIFKNDPGRRDCSLVGYRALSCVRSANMISNDTMLFQIAYSISPEDGRVQTYWTLINL